MKLWRYIYTDTITEDESGEDKMYVPDNISLFENCPVSFNIPDGICYVHSDVEISELSIFKENAEMEPSVWEGEE
jgi:hypothetical protein